MNTELVFTLKCIPNLTYIEDIHLNCIYTVLFDFRSVIDPQVVVSQTGRKITCGNWFLPVGVCERMCGNWFLPVGVCKRMCGNWFLHVALLEFVRGCAATGSFQTSSRSTIWENVWEMVPDCCSVEVCERTCGNWLLPVGVCEGMCGNWFLPEWVCERTCLIAVVLQNYELRVQHSKAVIRGNTALLKCSFPGFVKDYITVTSWLQDSSFNIYPSIKGGNVPFSFFTYLYKFLI